VKNEDIDPKKEPSSVFGDSEDEGVFGGSEEPQQEVSWLDVVSREIVSF